MEAIRVERVEAFLAEPKMVCFELEYATRLWIINGIYSHDSVSFRRFKGDFVA